MIRTRRLWIYVCAILFTLTADAQQLESLREEIRQAEEDIRITDQLLSKTQKSQKNADQQLKLIQNKIRNRKNIISNLDKQSNLIGNDIGTKNTTIRSLEGDLNQLKKEYAAMVYDAYKNYKLNNFMLFLFSSRDFNDATLRIAYMQRYNRMRELKAAEIDSLSASINREVNELEQQKSELDKVRQSRNAELNSLGKDETQYRATSNKLKKEAAKLSSSIRANKEKIDRLQQQIRKIITEESRKTNSKTQTTEQREYTAKLTGAFGQNMGKLPYPVHGVIVDRFGIHPHSTINGLTSNNTGVDIAADKGATVRAVFEGEVSQIFASPAGMNNGIIIRHGNYFTVYANLSSVSVKRGDKVALNQPIGQLAASEFEDNSTLHFEVWKWNGAGNPTNLNPEKWLHR